jgi:hypothetical protein
MCYLQATTQFRSGALGWPIRGDQYRIPDTDGTKEEDEKDATGSITSTFSHRDDLKHAHQNKLPLGKTELP